MNKWISKQEQSRFQEDTSSMETEILKEPPEDGLDVLKKILSYDELRFREVIKYQISKARDPNEMKIVDGHISEATTRQLVLHLISGQADETFKNVFLTTLPLFTSPEYLLISLYFLYYTHDNEGKNKIIDLLIYWINNYKFHFNKKMIRSLEIFAKQVESKKIHNKIYVKSRSRNLSNVLIAPITDIQFDFDIPNQTTYDMALTQIPPLELSRQIYHYDFTLLQKITNKDIFSIEERCEALYLMECFSDKLRNYVTMNIISEAKSKNRKKQFLFWFEVAKGLSKIKDFNALFAVMNGLLDPTVSRMKKTLKQLKKHLLGNTFKELSLSVSSDLDYGGYRNMIKNYFTLFDFIPYSMVIINDLDNIKKSFGSTSLNGLVNVKKLYSLSNTLNMLIFCRFNTINFNVQWKIQTLLEQLPPITHMVSMLKISRENEPDKSVKSLLNPFKTK